MTIRLPQLLALSVVLLVAALGLMRGCGGEERKVRRALADLSGLIEREEGESQLAAADKARRLGDHFTSDFQVRLMPFDVTLGDARELGRAFFGYRAGYETIDIDWREVEIEVDASGRRARVAAVAALSGRSRGGPSRESYRLVLVLRHDEDGWKIHQVTLIEVVEGLRGLL